MVKKTILPCGLTIISQTFTHSPAFSLSYTLKSGSRSENLEICGINHLIEHMLFKGCEKYNARQIADISDRLGGNLNAFTAKESTQYYNKAIDEHFSQTFDLLNQVVFDSTFPEDEYLKEKNIILQEIKEGEDTPDTFTFECFFEEIFPGDGLGYPVGGKAEWISPLSRNQAFDLYRRIYTPDQIILASSGSIPHSILAEKADAFFSHYPSAESKSPSFSAPRFRRILSGKRNRSLKQLYVLIGFPSISQLSEERFPFMILNDIAGAGMSSRLFQRIREEKGLAYTISSFLDSYWEQGIWVVYAVIDPNDIAPYLQAARQEVNLLLEKEISDDELQRAKDHLTAASVLGLESNTSKMRFNVNNELYFQHEIQPQEIVRRIQETTKEEITALARKYLRLENASFFAYGNIHPKKAEDIFSR